MSNEHVRNYEDYRGGDGDEMEPTVKGVPESHYAALKNHGRENSGIVRLTNGESVACQYIVAHENHVVARTVEGEHVRYPWRQIKRTVRVLPYDLQESESPSLMDELREGGR